MKRGKSKHRAVLLGAGSVIAAASVIAIVKSQRSKTAVNGLHETLLEESDAPVSTSSGSVDASAASERAAFTLGKDPKEVITKTVKVAREQLIELEKETRSVSVNAEDEVAFFDRVQKAEPIERHRLFAERQETLNLARKAQTDPELDKKLRYMDRLGKIAQLGEMVKILEGDSNRVASEKEMESFKKQILLFATNAMELVEETFAAEWSRLQQNYKDLANISRSRFQSLSSSVMSLSSKISSRVQFRRS